MMTTSKTNRGLAPFDEPVYLDHEAGLTPDDTVAATRSIPVVAFVSRGCVVAALSAMVPFLTDDDFLLVLAASVTVHLVATTVLDHVQPVEHGRVRLHWAVAFDVAFLAVVATIASEAPVLVTLGLLAVAFHRWLYGRRTAGVSVALTTMALAALMLDADSNVDAFTVVSVAAVGSLLVWLVDDQVTRHSMVTAGLHLMSDRANAVLEGIGDPIVSTSATGQIRDLNPAASQLLTCTPQDARGKSCRAVLRLETDDGRLDCSEGCAVLARHGSSVEVRRTGRNGERQPLLASAVALYDEDGDTVEVVHLLRDISDLKEAEDAKTMFLATASHELKTPLAVISGYAQLLDLPQVDDQVRAEGISAIKSRVAQLASIVDRLLMSSRIEAGRMELQMRSVSVSALVERQVSSFSRARCEVTLQVADDVPEAYADEAAVETVIDHLLDNAQKYSPDGGSIEVSVRAERNDVVIEVGDRGIGMTRAQMDLCFQRFWQAEGTDVRRFGGTGIGLHIVKSLVDAMDGRISVQANDGPGVTFSVRLRRLPVDAPPTDSTATPESATDGEASMIREFMRQVGVLTPSGDGS